MWNTAMGHVVNFCSISIKSEGCCVCDSINGVCPKSIRLWLDFGH
jgi:hypothetical protein